MGDPAGIGPEIIVKVLNNPKVYEKCNPLVIGDSGVIADALRICNMDLKILHFDTIKRVSFQPNQINILDLKNVNLKDLVYGKVNAACGEAAGQYIEKAIILALDKTIDAVVTAPINKKAFDLGGYGRKYRGHTEMLASLTNSKDAFMLLVSGNLRVIHVTTHIPMKEVVDLIKKERIYKTILKANEACRELGIKTPKIGVAGFNAHSGDNGIMGNEEMTQIIPAINSALSKGLNVQGPIPGDTIFPKCVSGTYDVIVAMYHDQGHIPVKMLGFKWTGDRWSVVSGVNITVGLSIIRTSVDHGTAFGKAGKGLADPTSLQEAIDYAILIAKNRKKKVN